MTKLTCVCGAPPTCDPEPTVESRVLDADLVVLARVLQNTPKVGKNHNTRTRVIVETTLKGSLKDRKIVVLSCNHFKCGTSTFRKGQRFIMFLREGSFWGRKIKSRERALQGWDCTNGFGGGAVPLAADSRDVTAIFAATGAELPRAAREQ